MSEQAVKQSIPTQRFCGEQSVPQVVSLLHQGECVALPTETVYGLAADASNPDAVAKIFAAKGRPRNHPLIVHIPSAKHLERWAQDIPDMAFKLAEHFWPGPLTLLLKKAPGVLSDVTGGLETIALRVPAKSLFLQVLEAFDGGLAAPSANRYKQLSPTAIEHVYHGLDGRIAGGLDGGPCEHGLESTIVDMLSDTPRVLRAGPITQQELQEVLQTQVDVPVQFDDVVPGNVQAHYQPRTPLSILTTEQISAKLTGSENAGVHFLVWSEALQQQLQKTGLDWQTISADAKQFGQAIYGTLYEIDQLQPALIVLEKPPQEDAWRAVNDRLRRAALPI